MPPLPEIHFGDAMTPLPDWRKLETDMDEDRDDDEQLDETPRDVVDLLGFDPLEAAPEDQRPDHSTPPQETNSP